MNDLISRQMLLEYIHGEPVGRLLCDKYNLDGLIEQLPDVQPEHPMVDITKVTMAMAKKADLVAVTRCKDCKWSDWYISADDKRYCYCYETGKGGRTEDDYCSFAERRTDE